MKRKAQIVKNVDLAAKAMKHYGIEKQENMMWMYVGLYSGLKWILDNQDPSDIAASLLGENEIKTVFQDEVVNSKRPHSWD